MVYLSASVVTNCMVLVMASITNAEFSPSFIFFVGIILGLPQIISYIKCEYEKVKKLKSVKYAL